MTPEIAIVLGLLLLAVVLFATEKLTVDMVTLLMLCVLGATRILTPAEVFAGFGNDILVVLGSIFVLGGALQRTGVLEGMAGRMLRLAQGGPKRLTALLMTSSGLLSAFLNNTTVTAMCVPPVTSLARRAGLSASKLLMPLAFAAIMGGTCTLIGTSTNVAVSGYLARSGYAPLGLFELAPIGLIVLATGTLFMVFVGSRLLPDYEDDAVTDPAEMRNYLAEVVVLPGSPLVGNQALKWDLSPLGFRLVEIIRGDGVLVPGPNTIIAAGDTLVVGGKVRDLRRVLTIEGLTFRSQLAPGEIESRPSSAGVSVAEAIILPGSELCGSTLDEVHFRPRYGLTVLAVNRSGQQLVEDLARIRLREGDVVLVHGTTARVDALLRPGSRFRQLGEPVRGPAERSGSRRHGIIAMTIFVSALICGATGVLPMAVAFLSAAVLVILCGCMTIEQAHACIDWRLLILVGGMTAFGAAMEKTGAADLLAQWMVAGLSPLGITAVLAGFFVLTIVLTQPMSNAAAALVVLPIAITAAKSLEANPRTFAIAVMLAASISFITPLEPACVLVYGAGKYRFRDFIVIGGLLTLLLTVVVLALIPVLWDL
jgi:di/tricarboxylate transporter